MLSLTTYDVSLSLLGGQLVGNLYISTIIQGQMQGQIQGQIYQLSANLLIIVNSYKLLNGTALWS